MIDSYSQTKLLGQLHQLKSHFTEQPCPEGQVIKILAEMECHTINYDNLNLQRNDR